MAGERLAELMMEAAAGQMSRQTPTDFVYGTVTSVAPLIIQVEDRFPVEEDKLVLSALCKPFITDLLKHRHAEDIGEYTDIQLDPVMVWRGLEVGDRVRMLQCQGGQKYYCLDREGSLP